jgi:hypothetical protein
MTASTLSSVRSGVCVLRTRYKAGSECGAPAAYRIYGADCFVCCEMAFREACIGHPVCLDHAAMLRTKSVAQVPAESRRRAPAFTVQRVHSLVTS